MLLIKDLIIIFSVAIGVIFICSKLRISSVIGFLITGILIGPHSLELVHSMAEVELLSEIGVILLLFTIGMEFSLKNLLEIKKAVVVGGLFQIALTMAVVMLILSLKEVSLNITIFAGFLVSLSSTAIVLKILQDRSEMDSPQGRSALAILIFQDIAVVPMMLALPYLSKGGGIESSIPILFVKICGIILGLILSIKWVVPWIFHQITRTRERELFMLSIMVICFAIAWLTHSAGLSLALGAFLAGLILSETEYSHEAISKILPFKDVFTSIFFVSVGMLFNINYLIQAPLSILGLASAIIVIKFMIIVLTMILLGFPFQIALLSAFSLCQVGEFSFILAKNGKELGLIDNSEYQLFLSLTFFTMIATPILIQVSGRFTSILEKIPIPPYLRKGRYHSTLKSQYPALDLLDEHLIIVGFGICGRNVSRSAKIGRIPYITVEMNPDTVKEEMKNGEPIIFGDASSEDVLKFAKIKKARVMVITIPDAPGVRKIISMAKRINPLVHIITRTRYVLEVESLYKLGADEVIPEEYETSIEIFSRVLLKYTIPYNEILALVEKIRSECYATFRNDSAHFQSLLVERKFVSTDFYKILISNNSPAANKKISDLAIRKKFKVSVLAIYRQQATIFNPDGEQIILPDDTLLIYGLREEFKNAMFLFNG